MSFSLQRHCYIFVLKPVPSATLHLLLDKEKIEQNIHNALHCVQCSCCFPLFILKKSSLNVLSRCVLFNDINEQADTALLLSHLVPVALDEKTGAEDG